jgi:3-isopropylmalate dehydratase small subunit
MTISGAIHKFGDHVDTDVIIPGRYLTLREPKDLGRHCLEGLDPGFAQRVKPGDVLVAGRNFGSGSSREHAPLAIKGAGIACVVAASFARIFYRNAINVGLPILTCPAFVAAARDGGEVAIDLGSGRIDFDGQRFQGDRLPEAVQQIVAAGGLVEYVRRRLA